MADDPFDITPEVLAKIEDDADALCEAVFDAVLAAHGWVGHKDFRSAVGGHLRSRIISVLGRQYKAGFYSGYMKRDEGAQAATVGWIGALLSGDLTVSPKLDRAPPVSAFDHGYQAYVDGTGLPTGPFERAFSDSAPDEQQFRAGWYAARDEAETAQDEEVEDILGVSAELRRGAKP